MSRPEIARAPRHPTPGRSDRASIVSMAGFVLLLHLLGWGTLVLVVAPEHYGVGTVGTFGIGLGVTAYLLGVRHAFDADHIAAVDNTTRKLVAEGRPSASVGFWFSLGHSTVVFGLALLLAAGVRTLAGAVADDGSRLQVMLSTTGTVVAGTFLVLIGLINLVALVGILGVFRRMRHGRLDEAELERQLDARGLLTRLLRPLLKAVSRPWHMYPIGFLFGLGFDTATEVALLVLAGGAAAFQLPWYAVLTLPVLFAAGMSLFDAADGVFMSRAYAWAFLGPVRKIYYNIVTTALSVAVALIIGGVGLTGLLGQKLGIPLLAAAGDITPDHTGYAIVGLFATTWVIAVVVWRFGRIEQRWSTGLHTEPGARC
jgi:high-affinity nickel-transport protein